MSPHDIDLVADDLVRNVRAFDAPLPPAQVDALWSRIANALPPPKRHLRRRVAAGIGLAVIGLAAALLLLMRAAPDAREDAPSARGLERAAALGRPAVTRGEAPRLEAVAPAPPRATAQEVPPTPVAPLPAPAKTRPHQPTTTPIAHAPAPAPLAPPPAALPAPPDRRAAAQRLLSEGQLAAAAGHMEALIEERRAGPAEELALRLDLARLYANHLGQPRRAVHHLRRFLDAHPDDPAAASVFRELCRLAALAGTTEPLCPVLAAEP